LNNPLVSHVSVPLTVLVINICWRLTLSLAPFLCPYCRATGNGNEQSIFFISILDVAFLIANHFKNQRRGFDWDSRRKEKETADVLYSELGGKRVDA
jgi:hypothetical protein